MKTFSRIASRVLLRKAATRTRGRIEEPALQAEVAVTRDAWGIPHIGARGIRDLFFAQGFVHAQDRLWQMETMRRLTSGRLSEIAGTATVPVDWYCRMLGMPEIKRRACRGLSEEERSFFEAYAEGVNACVRRMGRRLPLEFSMLGFAPEPWTLEDCVSSLPYLAWFLMFAPYAEKLLAVAVGGTLTLPEWNDMFPSHPGADLPPDDWFERAKGMRFGPLHPGALAFHSHLTGARAAEERVRLVMALALHGAGSNNWAVAKAGDGRPLLANDPHLGVGLPPVWYFCHLEAQGVLNAAGTSLPGTPGIVIGRNREVAWGMTNVMLDAVDILTYRVDPRDPMSYRSGDRALRMRKVPLAIGVRGGRTVELPLYLTECGPVLTAVEQGVDAVAVLKWYGTLPDGALEDRSFGGIFSFMKASSVSELLDAGRTWLYASQNMVAADAAGHIGWHATGAAPVRRGYSGRLPADASAGADWSGFLPYEALPRLMDPPEGWIATANNRPDRFPEAPTLSHVWFAPYRFQRIASALTGMRDPGVEEFRRLQMDVHSLQADRIIPKILAFPLADTRAREAATLLSRWDREMRAESAGAAVYEVFIRELTRVLVDEKLGGLLDLYLNARTYGVENEILDRPGSPLWNGAPVRVVENALAETMRWCESRMGAAMHRWSWGRLHRHAFRHPGGRGRFRSWLLNPSPFPAHGGSNTINVAAAMPGEEGFETTAIPSMRMIVAPADPDSMLIIGPLGQSGQPGHRHYDDMTEMWRTGGLVPVPLTREGVEKVARDRLVLAPPEGKR